MISKILKFSAVWCGPCRVLASNLKDFNRVPIEEINCDENEEEVSKYSVRNIPTLVFLDEHGMEVERTIGLVTIDQINKIIDKYEVNKA